MFVLSLLGILYSVRNQLVVIVITVGMVEVVINNVSVNVSYKRLDSIVGICYVFMISVFGVLDIVYGVSN